MGVQTGYYEIALTGDTLFAGGEIAAVLNPEGMNLAIVDVKVIVDTASTGVATLTVGFAAAATTSNNALIDALTINGVAAGTVYHGMTALAAKGAAVRWLSTYYLTATGSADTSGFTGRLWVEYLRLG